MLTPVSNLVETYRKNCKDKIEYHQRQARFAKNWDDIFRLSKIVSTSTSILTLSLMAVYDYRNFEISIAGASFIFLNNMIDEIQKSYNFLFISHCNHEAVSEFKEVLFKIDLTSLEEGVINSNLIEKYILLESKHIIQPVKNCFMSSCLFN